jgi:AraC-like DNA-binding protein
MAGPSALASLTLVLWRALEATGHDCEQLFRSAGLSTSLISDGKTRIPASQGRRLMNRVIEATQDPCFGIVVGQHWHPAAMQALGYAWLSSATLDAAIGRLQRYFGVVTTVMTLTTRHDADTTTMTLELADPTLLAPSALAYDAWLAVIVEMCRTCAGAQFGPQSVSLQHGRPPCAQRMDEFFGTPVRFDAEANELVFARSDLERPLPTANLEIARAADRIMDQQYPRGALETFSEQVRAVLVHMLPAGEIDEREVARELNTSPRTLQRRLAAEDHTFRGLLDEVRRSLAVAYTTEGRMSIKEISYLLGFSAPSNFTRAFKRWTGQAPSQMDRSPQSSHH